MRDSAARYDSEQNASEPQHQRAPLQNGVRDNPEQNVAEKCPAADKQIIQMDPVAQQFAFNTAGWAA